MSLDGVELWVGVIVLHRQRLHVLGKEALLGNVVDEPVACADDRLNPRRSGRQWVLVEVDLPGVPVGRRGIAWGQHGRVRSPVKRLEIGVRGRVMTCNPVNRPVWAGQASPRPGVIASNGCHVGYNAASICKRRPSHRCRGVVRCSNRLWRMCTELVRSTQPAPSLTATTDCHVCVVNKVP